MKKIVFLDAETIPPHLPLPPFSFEHRLTNYDFTPVDKIVSRAAEAEIIITNKVPLSAETLARLPKLQLISVAATGYDVIDLAACRAQEITVCNVRNYAEVSVPEHVLALIFALRRNLFAYSRDVRRGDWQQSRQFCFLPYPIGDLHGATLGIVGSGSLGSATGRLAEALGMKVIFAERRGAAEVRQGYLPLAELLPRVDILSLHCPLNEETRGMIGAAELAAMKPGALLINTGRGGLVEEQALAEALRSGHLGGAGFDVLSTEPPVDGNPLLDPELPNLIVTPHIAWGSDSAITTLADQVVESIEQFVAGTPVRVVQ